MGLSVSHQRSLHSRADARRLNREQLWNDVIRWCVPHHEAITLRFSSTDRNLEGTETVAQTRHIFDSVSFDATSDLVSTMHSLLFSPGVKWFGISVSDNLHTDIADEQERAQKTDLVQQFLNAMGDEIHEALQTSDFDKEIGIWLKNLILFGTAIFYCGPNNERDIGSPIKVKAIWPHEISFIHDGASRMPTHFFREILIYPEELRRQYPDSKKFVKNYLAREKRARDGRGEVDRRIRVLESIYYDNSRENSDKPWNYEMLFIPGDSAGKGYTEKDDTPIFVRTLPRSPYIITHWEKTPGETYGRGPAENALPSIKSLNTLMKQMMDANEWSLRPPLLANLADPTLTNRRRAIRPGILIPVLDTQNSLTPLSLKPQFFGSDALLDSLRTQIGNIFFRSSLPERRSEAMTEAEVSHRTQEISRRIAAPFSNIITDFAPPFLNAVAATLAAQGLIAKDAGGLDLKINGPNAKVFLTTQVAQYQARDEIARTRQYMGHINEIQALATKPNGQPVALLIGLMNLRDLPHQLAKSYGIPIGTIVPKVEWLAFLDKMEEQEKLEAAAAIQGAAAAAAGQGGEGGGGGQPQ